MFTIILLAVGVPVAGVLALSFVLLWQDQQTIGLNYYGRSRAERQRFKRALRRWAVLLHPFIVLQAKMAKVTFDKARFSFRGVAGPRGSCNEASFQRAVDYQPEASDVFVVTQMRSGTTWMQHIVYEVLHRGAGTLVERDQTLYSVSPWLEGLRSVSMEAAPLLGSDRPSRIIKTHMPVDLCPQHPEARYIYVVRHPVSCLASCVNFIQASLGRFTPELSAIVDWFESEDDMWWGPWPDHVEGWWSRAGQESNILFLQFEGVKRDLSGTVAQVADFLGVSALKSHELERIIEKCGFDYMKHHDNMFEMAPPHILSVDAEVFVSGRVNRKADLPEDVGTEVRRWCKKSLAGKDLTGFNFYPDVFQG